MKKWPADNQPETFGNLSRPLKAFFKRAFTIQDKPGTVRYTGHSGSTGAAAPLDYNFTADGVEYNREQRRDRLECAINAAIQVGIEQGRRIEIEKHRSKIEWAIRMLDHNDVDKIPTAKEFLTIIRDSWKD